MIITICQIINVVIKGFSYFIIFHLFSYFFSISTQVLTHQTFLEQNFIFWINEIVYFFKH
jgi:hypothetical protein